jgi:hypothetical protein
MATIPRGHHIHHTCRVCSCVNPAHLELLTLAEHNQLHAQADTNLATILSATQTNSNQEEPVDTSDSHGVNGF